MLKRFAVMIAATALMGVFAFEALAVSPHFKGRSPISFTDNGLTLSATASYAGLGNFNTLQVLTATGNTTSTCTNNGGNQAPGQNPAPVTLVGETPIPAGDIKNGNVSIATSTAAPVTPVPGAPGCPNPGWTEDINTVSFTTANIQLFQDANGDNVFQPNELVLTANCTFSPPTSNGSVPSSGFTCTTA
jgi:hypothetical protein